MPSARKNPARKTGTRRPASALAPDDSLFYLAFHNSPAMQSIIRVDTGKFVQVNDTFLKNLGCTRRQITGKTALELNFWVEPEKLAAYKLELESSGSVSGREVRLRAADGRTLTVLLSTHPVTIGGVPHFLSAGVDITAEKRAEQALRDAEARTRGLYDSISAAVIVHDETGFLQFNQASLKLFGTISSEDILGRHPVDFSAARQPDGEDSATAAKRHVERALTNGVEHFEWMARRLDGTEIPVEVTLTAVMLEGRPAIQAVIIDLSERKRAEAELQHALAKERELHQLKSEFVSLVSHEFRTPLEVIMSAVDNLQRYHERLAPEKRSHLLSTINRSVCRMSDMMEEVLVLGRLETGGMTFSPARIDLPALCRRLCDEIDSATGSRCPVKLDTANVPWQARGDESLLRHIFANLLSNAIKYSPAGTPVDFAVHRDGTTAVCRIADRGCGIPFADQKHLFEAFHRGSNVRQVPGTGLGLLIVRRSVALHGGDIQFESSEGTGTTFTVRLPLWD